MLFIGPTPLSGIGQHCMKYTKLFPGSKYLELNKVGEDLPEKCDEIFAFLIPFPGVTEFCRKMKTIANKITVMTVCETETVHPDYGLIFEEFKKIAVPSVFCKNILSRQFPHNEFFVIHAHIPEKKRPYTFYHIGNVFDGRKQVNKIIEAFIRLNKEDSRLLIKATHFKQWHPNIPRVKVINGLLPESDMEDVHTMGDVYVSFSKSEGVGMGQVEAAIRDKPVITTGYGGSTEYIQTPYMIPCTKGVVEEDDFLFQKGMEWGNPSFDHLLEYMTECYEKKLTFMDGTHTRQMVSGENITREFLEQCSWSREQSDQ